MFLRIDQCYTIIVIQLEFLLLVYLLKIADRAMQLNQGWFLANGRCGYVLQPEYLKHANYSPFNKHTVVGIDPVTVTITVGLQSRFFFVYFKISLIFSTKHFELKPYIS